MFPRLPLFATVLFAAVSVSAWDQDGHRMVNEVALASLPADFPAFVRDPVNARRIALLSSEPDRWSHSPDLPIHHANWMDHFCDVEQIPAVGLDYAKLPSLRYDFAVQFAAARAAHPDRVPAIDPAKDLDHTREWCGFLPWTITEYYDMLKAGFASLKVYQELGTPQEVADLESSLVQIMAIMGHYVGDSAQPLHTTIHHNGWVGPNPNGYTTWARFHSWIDSGFIIKERIRFADFSDRITPAQPLTLAPRADGRDPVFAIVLDHLLAGNQLVAPLYELEKAGRLDDEAEKAGRRAAAPSPVDPEARKFIEDRLLAGGELLGALWMTASKQAAPDPFLRGQLLKRQAAASGK